MENGLRPAVPAELRATATDPLTVDRAILMAGRRELLIRHGDDTYRLRLTTTGKLILTK